MLRGFRDSAGVEWRVWEVLPNQALAESGGITSRSSLKDTPFANGWLCFECENEKRRLAPIPTNWEKQDGTRLESLCQQAAAVPVRRRRRSDDGPGAEASQA